MKNKLKSCSEPILLHIFSDFYFIFLCNPYMCSYRFLSHTPVTFIWAAWRYNQLELRFYFFPFKSEHNFFSLSTIHDKILNFLFLEFNKSTATHAAIALKCTSSPAGIWKERFTDHSWFLKVRVLVCTSDGCQVYVYILENYCKVQENSKHFLVQFLAAVTQFWISQESSSYCVQMKSYLPRFISMARNFLYVLVDRSPLGNLFLYRWCICYLSQAE